jgi:Protein of unknown function (DUF4232)
VSGSSVRLRWAATALVVGAAGLLASACSSGGSSTPTTSGSTTTTGATTSTTSSTTTSSSTTTTSSTSSTCQPSQLSMAVGQGSGAAGTIAESIVMTNTSTTTCTMFGYPGMQLLDANGNALPTNVVRGGATFLSAAANQSPSTVTLAPGKVASFGLVYSDVPVGTQTSCPTSAKSEITPPNDTAFAVIALAISPCNGGTVHVSPVYLGT